MILGGMLGEGRRPRTARLLPALILFVAIGIGIPSLASAQWRPRIVRDGTVSLGLYGQGGTILGGGDLGDPFGTGLGLAFRLRYRIGRETAIGLNFEGQRYDAKDPVVEPEDPRWLTNIVTSVEYYQYFRVRNRAPRYLFLGAGLVQTRSELATGETIFPGDGGIITLGAGTEIWWKRTFSFDLGLRYGGVIKGSEGSTDFTHTLQLALGFQFYTSR